MVVIFTTMGLGLQTATEGKDEMPISLFGLGRPSARDPDRVGPVQAKILSFVATQTGDAHGVSIAQHLRTAHDAEFTDAQAYVALKRLEARGFLASDMTPSDNDKTTPSKRSRGRPRKYYSLTSSGRRALKGVGVDNSGLNPDGDQEGKYYDHQISRPTVVG